MYKSDQFVLIKIGLNKIVNRMFQRNTRYYIILISLKYLTWCFISSTWIKINCITIHDLYAIQANENNLQAVYRITIITLAC